MKVTVHNFFKEGNGYTYIKDNITYFITNEMMECLKFQYKIMGWRAFESTTAISFSYAHDEIEIFMNRLHGKAM